MKLNPPKMFLLNLTQVGGSSSGDGMLAPSRWKMALTCEKMVLDLYSTKNLIKIILIEADIGIKGLGNLDLDFSILCRIEGKGFLQPVEM